MTDLEQLCEDALYEVVHVLEDGKSIVRDVPTGKVYYKKILDVYNPEVFAYLKAHRNRHVPGIQAFWKEGESLVVIEEFVQGQTLEEMLEQHEKAAAPDSLDAAAADDRGVAAANTEKSEQETYPLPFSETIDILCQICDGLTFLHSANPPIIHRDIKASNIMVTDDGIVKIIDYDAAKRFVTGQSKDTVMMGTQGLAAPEQYGFAQSDVRTDLYALGKLIARMLPGNIDAQLITAKATEMDPKKRFQSAEQMKAQILRIREHPAMLDQKLSVIPGYVPTDKRHRILARIVLTAAVTALMAITIVLGWRLFVYPKQVNAQLEASLASVDEMGGADNELPGAVIDIIKSYDYQKLNAEQKKAFRDTMVGAMRKCYVAARPENVEQIRNNLVNAYGDEGVWDALCKYAEAGYEIVHENFDKAFEIVAEQREAGAVDAEEHWQVALDAARTKAQDYLSKYQSEYGLNDLKMCVKTYLALTEYEEESKSELENVYALATEKAEECREEQDFDQAEEIYETLLSAGYPDEEGLNEQIKETGYLEAGVKYEKKAYGDAARGYKKLGDYKDSAERYRESTYNLGLANLENGLYQAAISSFSEISGYKDADDRVWEAKYRFCEANVESPTEMIYGYIEELVENDYPGAEELRDEMYEWHVAISSSKAYSLGAIQGASIKAALSGGPPDGAVVITFRIYDPTRNETDSWSDGKEYHSGETASVEYSESDSSYELFDRRYKLTIYAKGDGIDGVLGTWEGKFGEDE